MTDSSRITKIYKFFVVDTLSSTECAAIRMASTAPHVVASPPKICLLFETVGFNNSSLHNNAS
jgi:hypothetical protein